MLKRLSFSLVTLALIAGCTGSDPFKPNAIISNVEPNRGASGRTLQVEIHGDFTKWKASTIEAGDVTFGDGVTVNSLTVANEGYLVADISIAPNAPLGAHDVDVDGETAVGVFQVVPPFTIEETVYAGGYGFITIIGEGTDWLDGITTVTTASDDVIVYGFSVEAPNVIRALVVTDLFAPAGGVDLAVTGIAIDDEVPGVLTVATVTPIVLNGSANASGTVGGNNVVVLRIPAGAIGDISDITFLDTTTHPDIDTLVFNEDDGLFPIADPDNGDLFQSIAFGNGDKDIYVTVQDYYNAGPELPFEYDFLKTSLNPTLITAQLTAQTIPAADEQRWYYYSGTKWNLSTATVTPTAAVPTLDAVVTISRDGVQEPFSVDDTGSPNPETTTFLNGLRSNAFITVENFTSASGADTEFSLDWAQAPVEGVIFETATAEVPIPDAVFLGPDGVLESTIAIANDPTAGVGITQMHVLLDIGHTYQSDLTITLQGPDQTTVTVWNEDGGSGNGILHSIGGSLVEDTFVVNLSAFDTLTPVGTWTLTITDPYSGDAGTLHSWALAIE